MGDSCQRRYGLKTKAVLVDLDDTLVAFDAVGEYSWQQVCQGYCDRGAALPPDKVLGAIQEAAQWYWSDAQRHRLGRNDLKSARRSIVTKAFAGIGLPEVDAIAVADEYSRVRLENMYVLPGAKPTLQTMRDRGLQLVLATNGDSGTQWYKIRRFGLEEYFDHILIEGELGYGKPDPRVYQQALSHLQITAEAACMVGDNIDWDVAGPQRLGIRGIWLDRKGTGIPSGLDIVPHGVIGRIEELPPLLFSDPFRSNPA